MAHSTLAIKPKNPSSVLRTYIVDCKMGELTAKSYPRTSSCKFWHVPFCIYIPTILHTCTCLYILFQNEKVRETESVYFFQRQIWNLLRFFQGSRNPRDWFRTLQHTTCLFKTTAHGKT